MNDLKRSQQQTHSPETLTELSPQELLQRIHAAETAIFSRLQGMRISSINFVEGQAIRLGVFGASHERNTGICRFASRSDSRRRQRLGLDPDKLLPYGDAHPVSRLAVDRPTPLMVVSSDRTGSEYVLQAI